MILNKISGKIEGEKDITTQRKLLINALDVILIIIIKIFNQAAAELGDQNAASICCANLGILEGSNKFEEYSLDN